MSDSYEARKRKLESLKRDGELNQILDVAHELFGNPIFVHDMSYNLLAYTKGVVTDDPLWNEITNDGAFSHDSVDFFIRDGIVETIARADTVAFIKSDKLKYQRMNGKLFDKDGVQIGGIGIVASNREFGEGDAELFGILCDIFSSALEKSELYHNLERAYQESFIDKLIDGEAYGKEEIKSWIADLSEELRPYVHLAVIETNGYERNTTHLVYFCNLFKCVQPEYKYFIHRNNILALINTDRKTLGIEKDLGGLNVFFKRYNIFAGLSGLVHDLSDLRKYYREAINALNYGLRDKKDRWIYRYDGIRIEHFLNTIRDRAFLNEICDPLVFQMQEYDRENNTALIELFFTYLSCGMDLELTCVRMGIDEQELEYRKKKLEDIFDIDWKDGEMLLTIYFSIKMLYGLENE